MRALGGEARHLIAAARMPQQRHRAEIPFLKPCQPRINFIQCIEMAVAVKGLAVLHAMPIINPQRQIDRQRVQSAFDQDVV